MEGVVKQGSRLALVSGANRGIGLAIVAGLARQGIEVLMGCRDLEKGREACAPLLAEGLAVAPVVLDVTDEASTSVLAANIAREYGSLDILVNNAGIALDFDPSFSPAQRMLRTIDVNVAGMIRLTEAMKSMLSASGHGRIVNISSELASFGSRTDPAWEFAQFQLPTYAASKAAMNALTLSYAKELKDVGIKVNAICPGYTATEATNFAGTRTPEQGAAVAVSFALLDDDGATGTFHNEAGVLPW